MLVQGEELLALTVLQPYASAIVFGPKRVENRSWRPPAELIGRRLAIHAGKSDALLFDLPLMREVSGIWPGMPRMLREFPRGRVLGTAKVVGVETPADRPSDPWASGPYCWVLEDVRPCEPVPMSGRQRLWSVEPSAAVRILAPQREG